MGYHAHDAIVVTAWDEKSIRGAHAKAVDLFGDQVTAITSPAINGYVSFLVPPDGSKEFWDDSDQADIKRAELIDFMRKSGDYLDFISVRFGGDFESENSPVINASTTSYE